MTADLTLSRALEEQSAETFWPLVVSLTAMAPADINRLAEMQ